VYIANILKCRPPDNRDPKAEEAAACSGYLDRQIALIAPKLILAVGRIAAVTLLREDVPLARLRSRVHNYGPGGIPLVATYHPAYLLRSPGQKRKAWDDLTFARRVVSPVTA
jgi:DNA polymerase